MTLLSKFARSATRCKEAVRIYKAEFFDRNFNFIFFSVIPEPEIIFDYLTLDKTSIVIPSVADISRGWYCHITQESSAAAVYQGFVSGVDTGKSTTTVKLSPLVALFDFQFFYNRKTYNDNKTDVEGWFRSAILGAFAGADAVQNIPGLTVTAATHTDGVDMNLKDNVHDLWDLARKVIQNSRIAIACDFSPQEKTINVVIENHSSEGEITLEADLPNISEQKFTIRDDWGDVNKVIIYNAKDPTQFQTFYASDYAAPTVQRVAEVTVEEGETFANAARTKSAELMRKSDADNLIELSFRTADKMIPEIETGRRVRILKNGKEYHSVLTGYAQKGGTKTYIFGGIRIDLSKRLKLKGTI